jgi:1,4-dihydroxy-2-naphthoate octaprenyltransferase
MNPWVLAARPKTLVAGFVPVAIGSALAFRAGKFQPLVFLAALFGALFIQIGSNYVNDGADFEKGADTEDRLGPMRMAASGALTPKALYWGAGLCFALAFTLGMYLVLVAGWGIFALGVASIIFAAAYTAGPFPLAYLGLGDLFVLIFFGLAAVLGTFYSHTQSLTSGALSLALATGIHGMALIAINNLRDIPTDEKIGKRTLAVRMGDQGSRWYFAILQILPYFFWIPFVPTLAFGWLPFLALLIAVVNVRSGFQITDRRMFNQLLAKVAAHQLVYGILVVLALVIG